MKTPKLKTIPNKNDHRFGELRAQAVLLEYGDFECSHSAMTAPMIRSLVNEFNGNLCFVYRHHPINSLHPYATMASIAAEAADQQSQFWPMHQLLFQYNDSLSYETILIIARRLKLDLIRFQADMEREDLLERVHQDHQSGERNKVESTPTFYLNNYLYEGEITYGSLRESIEKNIEQSKRPVPLSHKTRSSFFIERTM
jgi:protein-disulfide isomerase